MSIPWSVIFPNLLLLSHFQGWKAFPWGLHDRPPFESYNSLGFKWYSNHQWYAALSAFYPRASQLFVVLIRLVFPSLQAILAINLPTVFLAWLSVSANQPFICYWTRQTYCTSSTSLTFVTQMTGYPSFSIAHFELFGTWDLRHLSLDSWAHLP